jgi:KUP system potassium uptake protein
VLSAVSGLHIAIPSLQQGEVIGVAIVVLVVLFSVQYMGTSKIAAAFAPIITVWLLFNAGIGLTNLSRFGWTAWQVCGSGSGLFEVLVQCVCCAQE